MTNVNLSRRALIGAVALPAVTPASAIFATVAANADPIHAAIAAYRAAEAMIPPGAVVSDAECTAHLHRELAVWRTEPTTFQGLLAKMRFGRAGRWGWSELDDAQQLLDIKIEMAITDSHETFVNDLARLVGAS